MAGRMKAAVVHKFQEPLRLGQASPERVKQVTGAKHRSRNR
jgi:hypothetical protein